MTDILDAIAEFRVAFLRHNLEPPEVILLKSHSDAMKLICELNQDHFLIYGPGQFGKPIEHPDGSVWMEMEVLGMKIRWPANIMATENGYVWM